MTQTLERLSVRAAPSGPSKSTTAAGWTDIPDMSASLATPANADLEITFGGEVYTSGGKRMYLVVDGVRVNTMVEAYIGSPPSLGLVAHELAHILLGAGDMYFGFFQPYAAGPYSIMDQSPASPPHLDPFHKLRLGWLTPIVVPTSGWYTIRDVESQGEAHILYSPLRGDSEYFVIENRWRGTSYDSHIPHNGIAVWHIIEDQAVYDSLPTPPGVNAQQWNDPKWKGWSRRAIRMVRPIYGPPINWRLWDGADTATGYDLKSTDPNPNHVTLRWADGTPSGFAMSSIPSASASMAVHLTCAVRKWARNRGAVSVPRCRTASPTPDPAGTDDDYVVAQTGLPREWIAAGATSRAASSQMQ